MYFGGFLRSLLEHPIENFVELPFVDFHLLSLIATVPEKSSDRHARTWVVVKSTESSV